MIWGRSIFKKCRKNWKYALVLMSFFKAHPVYSESRFQPVHRSINKDYSCLKAMCLYLYEMRKLPLSCPILDLAWHGSWMNLNRNGLTESCTRATRKTGLSSEPLQRMRGLNFKWEKGGLLRKKAIIYILLLHNF